LLETFTKDRFRHTAMNQVPRHNSYLLLFVFSSQEAESVCQAVSEASWQDP
jgi:hypothetical protein